MYITTFENKQAFTKLSKLNKEGYCYGAYQECCN